ncbi:hypothetical protein ACB098_03G003700 [Castanea mollissima]
MDSDVLNFLSLMKSVALVLMLGSATVSASSQEQCTEVLGSQVSADKGWVLPCTGWLL